MIIGNINKICKKTKKKQKTIFNNTTKGLTILL